MLNHNILYGYVPNMESLRLDYTENYAYFLSFKNKSLNLHNSQIVKQWQNT